MDFQLHKAVEAFASKPVEERIFQVDTTDEFQLLYLKSRLPGGALFMRVDAGRFSPEQYDELSFDLGWMAARLEWAIRFELLLSDVDAPTAARIALDTLRHKLTTQNGLARTEAAKRSYRKEAIRAAARELRVYVDTKANGTAPIPKSIADTLRLYTASDDSLFAGRNALRIAGAHVDRDEVVKLLQHRAQIVVFNDFTGSEFQLFFELFRRWIADGRPDSISVERTAFVRSLGYQSTGRTFLNAANKLRDQVKQWRTPEPYRVAVSDAETGGVDMRSEVYLPTLREYAASRQTKNRTLWVFSDFDALLFPRESTGGRFHRIPTRPFKVITETMGNTRGADKAKTAAGRILTEVTFGRTRPFAMELETLEMHRNDFARHTGKRDEAMQALSDALALEGIGIESDSRIATITPNAPGIERQ